MSGNGVAIAPMSAELKSGKNIKIEGLTRSNVSEKKKKN
jgi:hypothetical protein